MEVSNEIKEEIRKTQSELKNAIKIHQVSLLLYWILFDIDKKYIFNILLVSA